MFTSKAEQSEYEQLDLFQTARNEKQEKLDKAIDQIRKKYGEDSVRRARFLDGEMNHMAGGLNKEKSRYRQKREEISKEPSVKIDRWLLRIISTFSISAKQMLVYEQSAWDQTDYFST